MEVNRFVDLQTTIASARADNVIDQQEAAEIAQQVQSAIEAKRSEGATEIQIIDFVNGELTQVLEAEFEPTNLSFSFGIDDHSGEDDFQSSQITFNLGNEEVGNREYLSMVVSNTEESSHDTQFTTLRADNSNYISFDPQTGAISGFEGTNAAEAVSVADAGISSNMRGLIMNDFGAELRQQFRITPNMNPQQRSQVLENFKTALQSIPGNESNPLLTDENVANLLSYINTGANTSGQVDVAQLQGLLRGLTGPTGSDLSAQNTDFTGDSGQVPRGDGKYGWNTTLQVRSLSAAVNNTPENIEAHSTATVRDNHDIPETYRLAVRLADTSPSTERMRAEQTAQLDADIEAGRYEQVITGEFDGGTGNRESAIQASINAFNRPEFATLQPGDAVKITSFVDTNDSTTMAQFQALQQRVDEFAERGIRVDVTFTFGNVEISLADINPDNFINPTRQIENLEWAEIAMPQFEQMSTPDLLEAYSLIEVHSSSTQALDQLVASRINEMTPDQVVDLLTNSPIDVSKLATNSNSGKGGPVYAAVRTQLATFSDSQLRDILANIRTVRQQEGNQVNMSPLQTLFGSAMRLNGAR